MCGISGILSNDVPHAKNCVWQMNAAQEHRGPDADGIWTDDQHLVLGHRRLSIIDTDERANQPFVVSSLPLVMVFNGEVYNYLELRDEIGDQYRFRTNSDTETVYASFLLWGREALRKFNGMFAIALWDQRDQSLLLARDRLGIKPLYFATPNNGVVFASEIRAILKSGLVERRFNRLCLSEFLRYQTVHSPRTLVESVEQVEAGTAVIFRNQEVQKWKWWDLKEGTKIWTGDRQELQKSVRSLLQDSVNLRMRSDVPFGAFLSGGIDSSAIVGLMAESTNQAVRTFSVTFDEGKFDESSYSRMIAKRFHTKHEEIRLSPSHFLDQIPEAMAAIDHPSGDGPNTYIVSKSTRDAGITVALSGLGGDELFAGYPVFKRSLWLNRFGFVSHFPRFFRKLCGSVIRLKKGTGQRKLASLVERGYFDVAHSYPVSRQVFLDDELDQLLAYEANNDLVADEFKQVLNGQVFGKLSQVSVGELQTYMQHVLLRDTDQMSMSRSLEIRVPFLDHRLVELVLGVSDNLKYPTSPKKLLIDSLDGLLPTEIINRPKMGFTLPWESWMRNELQEFCQESLANLECIADLNMDSIRQMWGDFLQPGPQAKTWSRIWVLVSLGSWLKLNSIN